MAEMPEEGVFTPGKVDAATGARWVYVTPAMARAHPKGRLSVGLWLVVLYFTAVAALRVAEVAVLGVHGHWAMSAVLIVLPLACALLLALRAPWGAVLVIVLSALSVVGAFTGIGADDPANLINIAVLLGIAVYIQSGDRPNLIYRHRYRSYSALEEGDGEGA